MIWSIGIRLFMKSTIVSNINRQQFIIKYIMLNIITLALIFSNIIERSAVLYMLAGIFAPIIILVYEAVIITGRLHDINRPVILALLIVYLKYQIMVRLFLGQSDPMILIATSTIIYLLSYIVFILILCVRKSYEKVL